jgi:hypothetical protein
MRMMKPNLSFSSEFLIAEKAISDGHPVTGKRKPVGIRQVGSIQLQLPVDRGSYQLDSTFSMESIAGKIGTDGHALTIKRPLTTIGQASVIEPQMPTYMCVWQLDFAISLESLIAKQVTADGHPVADKRQPVRTSQVSRFQCQDRRDVHRLAYHLLYLAPVKNQTTVYLGRCGVQRLQHRSRQINRPCACPSKQNLG